LRPSKKMAFTDLSFNHKILAKYRMGKRNPFWLPLMIFYKSIEPFFLNQRLIQGWLPLPLYVKQSYFPLVKSIQDGPGLSLGDAVEKIIPGSFLGRVTQLLEKVLFWIRRESKPRDPFYPPWLERILSVLSSEWMPAKTRLLLGSPTSPSMIRTLHPPLIGKGIDLRTGSDSRMDQWIRPRPETNKGKQLDSLNEEIFSRTSGLNGTMSRPLPKSEPVDRGIPPSPGDKMAAFIEVGSRIPPISESYPSFIRPQVPLTGKMMGSQSQGRRNRLHDQFFIETSPANRVYEKHLLPLALFESLSQAQVHIPSHRAKQTSTALSARRTGYGADERDYFFRREGLHPEIESLKKSVAVTQKALEERERRRLSSDEMQVMRSINIHHLANQVYRSIERRIAIDRERRGIY
jgi:hypothetical protein